MSDFPPDHSAGTDTDALPTRASTRGARREERRKRKARNRLIWTLVAVVVVLAIVAGVVWLVNRDDDSEEEPVETTTERNESPGLDGVIAENVAPEDIQPGDCLTNFEDTDSPATIIDCSMAHQAQLVGRQIFADAMEYPGADEVRAKAEEFCAGIELTGQTDAVVVTHLSNPSEGSWQEGDRRVDCTVVAEDDTLLSDSLIDEPVVNDLNASAEGSESGAESASSEEATEE